MTTTSIERFMRAAAPQGTAGSRHPSPPRLLRFLLNQRATLAASFQVARAYEQADTVAARRDALDRFAVHLRG